MNNIASHWWKLWQVSWTFSTPSFQDWRFLRPLGGLRLSLGFWIRVCQDRVIEKAVSNNTEIGLYQPIDKRAFRLLALEPGEFSDPLKGALVVCSLDDMSTDYEALSYMWGPQDSNCYVDLEGHYFRITSNLEDALRHLRSSSGTRHIWADAVCIDQSNIAERSHQVRLMDEIFMKARKVNIWLGLANEDTAVGMEILSFLASDKDFHSDSPWMCSSPELLRAGLNDVLHRAYFQRIWVVQELVVARSLTITCGRLSFGWVAEETDRFLTRLKFAEISPSWEEAGLTEVDMSPLVAMVELANIRAHALRPTVGSLDIMHNMRRRKATDPRDMVFALLNIAADMSGLNMDYSMSKQEVYKELFRHIELVNQAQLQAVVKPSLTSD